MNFSRPVFLALAMGATLQVAQAQTAPRMIDRDELRACMESESQLTSRRESVEARSKQQTAELASIRAESEALQAERKRLEEGGVGSRDRLERRGRAYNERVKAANDAQAQLRAEIDAVSTALAAYNDKCGGTVFKDEDKEAILKERAAAGKK